MESPNVRGHPCVQATMESPKTHFVVQIELALYPGPAREGGPYFPSQQRAYMGTRLKLKRGHPSFPGPKGGQIRGVTAHERHVIHQPSHL